MFYVEQWDERSQSWGQFFFPERRFNSRAEAAIDLLNSAPNRYKLRVIQLWDVFTKG